MKIGFCIKDLDFRIYNVIFFAGECDHDGPDDSVGYHGAMWVDDIHKLSVREKATGHFVKLSEWEINDLCEFAIDGGYIE